MRSPFSIDPSSTAAFERIKGTLSPEARRAAKRPLRAVVIGGGTGAPVSIKTLLSMGVETSAIVAMADDGGSTGELREVADVTPPGDIRKCIVAFAADQHDPLTRAFKYRFDFANNHSLGNLMLSALEDATGSFPAAIDICESLLHARGHVYPSTLNHIALRSLTRAGEQLEGQARSSHADAPLSRVWLRETDVTPYSPAIEAIEDADLIVLGPGSLFTSVIPNLLVPGILEAIGRSKGKTVFVCSLADMQGETRGMTAQEHVEALLDHGMRGRLDYVLVHTPSPLRPEGSEGEDSAEDALSCEPAAVGAEGPARVRAVPVTYRMARAIQAEGPVVIARDLVDPLRPTWHDPQALRDAFAGVIRLCRSRQR